MKDALAYILANSEPDPRMVVTPTMILLRAYSDGHMLWSEVWMAKVGDEYIVKNHHDEVRHIATEAEAVRWMVEV